MIVNMFLHNSCQIVLGQTKDYNYMIFMSIPVCLNSWSVSCFTWKVQSFWPERHDSCQKFYNWLDSLANLMFNLLNLWWIHWTHTLSRSFVDQLAAMLARCYTVQMTQLVVANLHSTKTSMLNRLGTVKLEWVLGYCECSQYLDLKYRALVGVEGY